MKKNESRNRLTMIKKRTKRLILLFTGLLLPCFFVLVAIWTDSPRCLATAVTLLVFSFFATMASGFLED